MIWMNYPSKPDWQHGEDDRSPPKPKLQLEPAGGGPGTRRPTAIGTGDFSADGSHIDLTGLPDAPWWFLGLAPFLTRKFKSQFEALPLDEAMAILHHAKIPPTYRLGLGLRWGFLDPVADNFTHEHFYYLTNSSIFPFDGIKVRKQLEAIEVRSSYQIWRQIGPNITQFISPGFESEPPDPQV